jgi:two-component system, response regulator
VSPRRAQVLLAEDNASDAELILLALGQENLSSLVHHVEDGEEALDFVFCRGAHTGRSFGAPPRLVILDIKLPKVSGLEVLREMKRDARTFAIPVVLLTSSKIESEVARGYRLGANSYVQKPVDFDLFRTAIQRLGRYWLSVNEPAPPLAFRSEEG